MNHVILSRLTNFHSFGWHFQRCEETQRLYESLRAGLSEEQTAQAEAAESLIGQLVAFTRKLLETHIYRLEDRPAKVWKLASFIKFGERNLAFSFSKTRAPWNYQFPLYYLLDILDKSLRCTYFSDIVFLLDDKSLKSHRFLLSCRSALWRNLSDCSELIIEGISLLIFPLLFGIWLIWNSGGKRQKRKAT